MGAEAFAARLPGNHGLEPSFWPVKCRSYFPSITFEFLSSAHWAPTSVVKTTMLRERSVHPKVLTPQGIPQGCPLGPLILAIWVSSGLKSVQTQIGNNPIVCYIDDRSFWGSTSDHVWLPTLPLGTGGPNIWDSKKTGPKRKLGKHCKQELFSVTLIMVSGFHQNFGSLHHLAG